MSLKEYTCKGCRKYGVPLKDGFCVFCTAEKVFSPVNLPLYIPMLDEDGLVRTDVRTTNPRVGVKEGAKNE